MIFRQLLVAVPFFFFGKIFLVIVCFYISFQWDIIWYCIQIKGLHSVYLHLINYDVVTKSTFLAFLNIVSTVHKVL